MPEQESIRRMKAIVKKHPKEGLWLEDMPKPQPGPDEVLIKTHKASICGTDVHIYKWDDWAQKDVRVPVIVGHEGMGVIEEVGDLVQGLNVGQRVACEGHLNCGFCRNCRTGTAHVCGETLGIGRHSNGLFAEYFTMPATHVYPLADSISDDVGAVLDPLGNAVHTTLHFPIVGEDVLITGAGPIGLMAIAIARQAGARHIVITDRNPFRLQLAKQMGCTAAVNIEEQDIAQVAKDLGIKEGFGVGLEMSGSAQGLNMMLTLMQPAGKVALLGILPASTQIDWDLVIFHGLTLQGIYGREMYGTWDKMDRMLQSGLDITPIITHHFRFEEYEQAFEAISSGQCAKVVLHW